MKRWTVLGFSALWVASMVFLPVVGGWAAEKGGKTVTITGEVIDVACFFAKGAKGSGHEKCAKMCIEGGVPAGLLADDGKIYILAGDMMENPEAFQKAKEYAAKRVSVTGTVIEKDGAKLLLVQSVQPAR
jgi:hypothetical protein